MFIRLVIMNFRKNRIEDVDINLTPLIDVVFLLLIFFMVSTTFDKNSKLQIDLPEAVEKGVEEDVKKVDISIDSKGNYYFNQKKLASNSRDGLLAELKSLIDKNPQLMVVIIADKKSMHQDVIRVLDVARSLGINHLSFATAVSE